MPDNSCRILLVEDDPEDAMILKELIAQGGEWIQCGVETADTLEKAIDLVTHDAEWDLILLDLSLPDSMGLETSVRMHAQAPSIPIVIMTGIDDETFALEAVRQGAQDYLVKGSVNGKMLARVIRYAIERNRTQAELRNLSLVDELTGLYNRRGFLTFAEQYLKLAQRNKKGMILMYADLDDLKKINDRFGHHEGDLALIRTAKSLRETFRKSDLVGRIGGDEFPIVAMEAERGKAETLVSHLQDNLKKMNAQTNSRYPLSVSVGVAYYDPEDVTCTVEDLMARADESLLEEKRKKQASA